MTEGKVTGANVSVKIDDDFMNAAVNGGPISNNIQLIRILPFM